MPVCHSADRRAGRCTLTDVDGVAAWHTDRVFERRKTRQIQVECGNAVVAPGQEVHVTLRWVDSRNQPLTGKHHEIYLNDPNRVAPKKLKTVLRQPVRSTG